MICGPETILEPIVVKTENILEFSEDIIPILEHNLEEMSNFEKLLNIHISDDIHIIDSIPLCSKSLVRTIGL